MNKNQIADNLQVLKRAFASSALEGLDNPKIEQYLIDLVKKGFTRKECLEEVQFQIKNNPEVFLAQFD